MPKKYSHKYFNAETEQFERIEFEIIEDFKFFKLRKGLKTSKIASIRYAQYFTVEEKIEDRKYLISLKQPNNKLFNREVNRIGYLDPRNRIYFKSREGSLFRNDKSEVIIRFPESYEQHQIDEDLKDLHPYEIGKFHKTYLFRFDSLSTALEIQKRFDAKEGFLAEFNFHTVNERSPAHLTKRIRPILESKFDDDPKRIKELQPQEVIDALKIVSGNKNIKIAILDSGIYPYHKNLLNSMNTEEGYDCFTDTNNQIPSFIDWHGSMCAGIAAAVPKDDYGIYGFGAGCTLIGIRIFEKKYTHNFHILKGFYVAGICKKVDVINCSFVLDYTSEILRELIVAIANDGRQNKMGANIVMAAGNKGKEVVFPNTLKEVITVTSVDEHNHPQNVPGIVVSGKGEKVDIAASGKNVITVDLPDGMKPPDLVNPPNLTDFIYFNATSAAAPQVSGCIGLMLSANEDIPSWKIKEILKSSATPFPIRTNEGTYGKGILNLEQTLKTIIN